jgi:hypothetical protein
MDPRMLKRGGEAPAPSPLSPAHIREIQRSPRWVAGQGAGRCEVPKTKCEKVLSWEREGVNCALRIWLELTASGHWYVISEE